MSQPEQAPAFRRGEHVTNFFNSSPEDPAVPAAGGAAPGGWTGLAGWKKLSIVGGVAFGGIGVLMWPNLSGSPAPVKPVAPDQHQQSTISDFQAAPPPAVQDVVARVMGDPTTAVAPSVPRRPVPTEMAIYVGKAPTSVSATAPTAGALGNAVSASNPFAPNAAVPTNHATLVVHPDYIIRAGDVIPCLPVGASDTSRANYATCRVPSWFRSSNQRRGLLAPGSRFFGSEKEGLAAGQQRIGISYILIETPWFNMPIQSPIGDAMGRGGVDADINTFFWERAGAVALYAAIDTTVGIGQNAGTNALSRSMGSNNGTNLNFHGASQSLAGREFDATINRPPVGTRDQALPATVTIGQDLDFYDACMMAPPMACPLQ